MHPLNININQDSQMHGGEAYGYSNFKELDPNILECKDNRVKLLIQNLYMLSPCPGSARK